MFTCTNKSLHNTLLWVHNSVVVLCWIPRHQSVVVNECSFSWFFCCFVFPLQYENPDGVTFTQSNFFFHSSFFLSFFLSLSQIMGVSILLGGSIMASVYNANDETQKRKRIQSTCCLINLFCLIPPFATQCTVWVCSVCSSYMLTYRLCMMLVCIQHDSLIC